MPKIGKLNVLSITPKELERIPNIPLGRYSHVTTNDVLRKDPKLQRYINKYTMGALDNYAKHENLSICITPLENDLFDDLCVDVIQNKKDSGIRFTMKIQDGKDGVRDFLKELYTKVENFVNPVKKQEVNHFKKPTKFKDFKLYVKNVKDRLHEYKVEKMRDFINKHESDKGINKTISDFIEETHYYELYPAD